MSSSVLVVGDANVDLVLTGDVMPRFGQAEQLLDGAALVLGGSASIVASGLAKLGVETYLAAVVGDDEFGRFTIDALSEAGVKLDAVVTDREAATGISVILSAPSDRSILTAPGALPLLGAAQVRTAVELLTPAHVHFASYFLLPRLAAELATLLGWLGSRGITTSLDTNWDPAEEWAGLAEVLPLVDILLPNLEELRAIAGVAASTAPGGSTTSAASTASGGSTDEERAASLGPRVVVKAGAAGGFSVARGGGVSRAAGLMVDVVDTTGAGDSFDAGYLAALAEGIVDEATRLAWATIAGSLSTRAAGGTAAQASRTELDEQLARVGR